MTAYNYSSGISNANTADFREWGLELSNALTGVGFLKSADTGQVDWATVELPSPTGYVYEIRYLNDSLHSTKPCYCKIEYGNSSGKPLLRFTCGSSTDGAGNITGITYLSTISLPSGNANIPPISSYFTAVCATDGYFGLSFKRGAFWQGGTLNTATFFITRTCDSSGTPTSAGFNFYFSSGSTLDRNTYINSSVQDEQSYACMFGGATSTLIGSDAQVARHFSRNPTTEVVPFVLSAFDGEIGNQSTFSLTPIGITERTYLMLGGGNGPTSCGLAKSNLQSALRVCMLYE